MGPRLNRHPSIFPGASFSSIGTKACCVKTCAPRFLSFTPTADHLGGPKGWWEASTNYWHTGKKPPETKTQKKMTVENPPWMSEDVFPIENHNFPASHVNFQGFLDSFSNFHRWGIFQINVHHQPYQQHPTHKKGILAITFTTFLFVRGTILEPSSKYRQLRRTSGKLSFIMAKAPLANCNSSGFNSGLKNFNKYDATE